MVFWISTSYDNTRNGTSDTRWWYDNNFNNEDEWIREERTYRSIDLKKKIDRKFGIQFGVDGDDG